MRYQKIEPGLHAVNCRSELASVIAAIGQHSFGDELHSFLQRACDVDRCIVVGLSDTCPSLIAIGSADGTWSALQDFDRYVVRRHWSVDPAVTELRYDHVGDLGPRMIRLPLQELGGLGKVIYGGTGYVDRLCAWEEVAGAKVMISALRTLRSGPFTESMIARFEETAHILLAAVANHGRTLSQADQLIGALTSLDTIEACIANAEEHLSNREIATCARILIGMSTTGISLDLDIGEETVTTYRKRAYCRLGIATQRELLLWYVRLWADARRSGFTRQSGAIAGMAGGRRVVMN